MILVEITEKQAKAIIRDYIASELINREVKPENVKFFLKSKHNYKSEWEEAALKVTYQDWE